MVMVNRTILHLWSTNTWFLQHGHVANLQTSSTGNGSILKLGIEKSEETGISSGAGIWSPDIWPMLDVFRACRLSDSIFILALVVIFWWVLTVCSLVDCVPITGLCYQLNVRWVNSGRCKSWPDIYAFLTEILGPLAWVMMWGWCGYGHCYLSLAEIVSPKWDGMWLGPSEDGRSVSTR